MATTITKRESTVLALHVRESRAYGAWRIIANVVTVGRTAKDASLPDDAIRSPLSDDPDINGLHVADLSAMAYGHEWERDRTRSISFYSPIEYRDVHTVGLERAERMARTLRTIHRRLEKMREQFGYSNTFGAFLARFATAIGAKSMIFDRGDRVSSLYTENDYTFLGIGDGASRVESMIFAWTTEDGRTPHVD